MGSYFIVEPATPDAQSPSSADAPVADEQELLDLYLSSSPRERTKAFADTAHTARIVGVTRRTIQLWIEAGAIRATRVGRRYQVFLPSVRDYLERCLRDN